jgi:hypothetical protein
MNMTGIKAVAAMAAMSGTMVLGQAVPKATELQEYVSAGTNVLLLAGILGLAAYIVWRQKHQDTIVSEATRMAATLAEKVASAAASAAEKTAENIHELRKSTDRLVVATSNVEAASVHTEAAAKTMHDAALLCAGNRVK